MFLPSLTSSDAGSCGNSSERHKKKMEEIGKNEKWGTLPGESQVECHSVGFPSRRNYSGGIGDVRNPSNTKQAAQPPNQPRKSTKHDKTSDNQMVLACSCMFLPSLTPFHAGSFGNSLDRHEKKMEETGKNEKLETFPG